MKGIPAQPSLPIKKSKMFNIDDKMILNLAGQDQAFMDYHPTYVYENRVGENG